MRVLSLLAGLILVTPSSYAISVSITLVGNGTLQTATGTGTPFVSSGTVTSSPFGNGSFTFNGQVLAGTNVAVGQMVLTFGTGNTISGDLALPATNLFPSLGQPLGGTGSAVITTGAGAFVNATGTFPSLAANGTSTGQGTSSFSISGSGEVNAPNYNPGGGTGIALRFVPAAPCRIADTRLAAGPFGGPVLAGGQSREFNITQSACNIPSTARAYSLNMTVVPTGPLSYLTLFPAGQTQPLVSTLNSFDGRIKANAAIVPAGTNGAVSVFVTNNAHAVIDINGYFVSSTGTENLAFYPITPCRAVDTRQTAGPYGGPIMASGQTRQFAIGNAVCNVPGTARAIAANYTVVPSSPLSFLTTYPSDVTQPLVSTLNAPTGTVVANAALVPLSANGAVNVFVTDTTHVVIDIAGYFAPPSATGFQFYSLAPCRVLDTRNPAGQFGGPQMAGNTTRTFPVLQSVCGIPSAARAISVNATVVPPAPFSYLSLFGNQTTSTLNAFDGAVTSNAAFAPLQTDSSLAAYASDRTDLLVDVNGYFAP